MSQAGGRAFYQGIIVSYCVSGDVNSDKGTRLEKRALLRTAAKVSSCTSSVT